MNEEILNKFLSSFGFAENFPDEEKYKKLEEELREALGKNSGVRVFRQFMDDSYRVVNDDKIPPGTIILQEEYQ